MAPKSDTPYEMTVVIPVYNEEGLLSTAINDLIPRLAEIPMTTEVIISQNGSKDKTPQIAAELAAKYDNVRVLNTDEPNYGLALRRGIKAAKGTYVMCDEIDICDVDFYRAALEILQANKADMVVGSKRHPDANDARPPMRKFATWVLNKMLKVAVGFQGTDTHGLKAFRREPVLPVVDRCIVDKDLFASELVIRAERLIRVVEIPVTIMEKRPPSINLFKRVPNVMRNMGRLFVVIRLNREA